MVTLKSGKRVYAEKHDRNTNTNDASTDIPILFIHGFMMTCESWRPLLDSFPEHTRILYDNEPHGKTGKSGNTITYPYLAQEAREVLSYFGYDKAIVVGHSAGGVIAVQLAGDFLGVVQTLILVTPMNIPPPSDGPERKQLFRSLSLEQLATIHKMFLGTKMREDPRVYALVEDAMYAHAPVRPELEESFDALMEMQFGGVGSAKTWVIRGTEDAVITKEVIGVVANLTNAKIIELDVGHYPMFEDRTGLIGALSRALRS